MESVCEVCAADFEKNSAEEKNWDNGELGYNDWDIVTADQGYTMTHICARNGHLNCIEKICLVGINNQSNEGMYTPLHLAVHAQHIPVINFLLKNEASLTIEDRRGKKVTDNGWFQTCVKEGTIIIPF